MSWPNMYGSLFLVFVMMFKGRFALNFDLVVCYCKSGITMFTEIKRKKHKIKYLKKLWHKMQNVLQNIYDQMFT